MAEFVYLTKDEVMDLAPDGTTDTDLAMAEQYARYTIKSLSYDFTSTLGSTVSYGNNSDILLTRERILTVTQLNENGVPVWYATPPVGFTNSFGWDLEVTETNQAIRIVNPGYLSREYEPVRVLPRHYAFKSDYRYEVFGTFGWEEIPEEIIFATRLLVQDWFCKDTSWRVKYVSDMKSSDWSMKFDPKKFGGSGNAIVDQILTDYNPNQLVVI